ncbi:hypothetical protein [Treponema brennaborense]|uniref:PDZ domain-containing protein n=1 Tax=Treponema brennaborense (strain DSM 12168 / CIP 105900 / DD5/3) TaxID=906968 RepID=F4LKC5_TREBD|nr:hypothetical protein [Treponema brennaborense]AEE16499.1 hypothetical protein Trebr_1067 [Treponema brennaborense DSM 12168]
MKQRNVLLISVMLVLAGKICAAEVTRIPFVIDESGNMLVHAVVGNTLGYFIFDTGAEIGIHITERIPEVCQHDRTATVQLLGHTYTADVYSIIGGLYLFPGELDYPVPLMYIPDYLHEYFKPGIKGIIGSSIFSPFAMEISFSENEIILHTDGIPEGYDSFTELVVSSGNPYVPISVDGKTVYALIDTGYSGKLSLPSDIDVKREVKIGTQNTAQDYSLVQPEYVSVFSAVSKNPIVPKQKRAQRINLNGMINPIREPALIGTGLLRFYDIIIDLQNGRFYYRKRQDAPDAAKTFSQTVRTSGIISARFENDLISIDEVAQNSPAWNEGIRPAMTITAVNGKSVSEYYSDILNIILAPLTKTSVTMQTGSAEKNIVLETVSFFAE